MSPYEVEAEWNAGDVLVIGAGVTGVLVARKLSRDGRAVTLLDRSGFGAEQSGHSHGYLHHGYIYRHGQDDLVRHLRSGAAAWEEILAECAVEPLSRVSHICFSNELTARAAAAAWRRAKLPVNALNDLPAGMRRSQVGLAYESAERTYDFSEFFERVAAEGETLNATRAEVLRLERTGRRIKSVLARVEGRCVRLRARAFVVAAGDQNAALAETATRFTGRAMVRSSLMAVVRGKRLPALSVVMPENETYGLFVVSRSDAEAQVWLVSNFISFLGHRLTEEAGDRWLCSLLDRLVVNCSGLAEPSNEWGLYEAPKGELRARPQTLGAHASEDYGFENLAVLAPTKLTLAPVLAAEVANELDGVLMRSSRPEGEAVAGPRLVACRERWRETPLDRADIFFASPSRRSALSRLERYARPRSTVV